MQEKAQTTSARPTFGWSGSNLNYRKQAIADRMSVKTKRQRSFDSIYVHEITLTCAVNGCLPCLYKINPTGVWDQPDSADKQYFLPPNQRPETCPRSSSQLYHGLFDRISKYRVLTLGDGDFSFSLAIANQYETLCQKKLVCTSHESRESILSTYPKASIHLDSLDALGAHVFHEIDATNLQQHTKQFPFRKYDRIVWNFPCVRIKDGLDGQMTELQDNIDLVKKFFLSAKHLLRNKHGIGEIHVAHKTVEPFCWWKIDDIARDCGLRHVGSIVFDRFLYPGYINRKVLDKSSFPCTDALIYIFQIRDIAMETTISQSGTLYHANIVSLFDEGISSRLLSAVKRLSKDNSIETTRKRRKFE